MSAPGRLSLRGYFGIEAVGAFASTLLAQGSYFWATSRHGYDETLCLLLGACQGLVYILSAKFGGALSSRLGYDRVLQLTLAGCALTALCLWPLPWSGTPFLIVAVFFAFTGPLWPAIEASLLHAPSTLSAPRRLGLYNIVWATFGSVGFFACGLLVELRLDAVLWLPGLLMAAILLVFLRKGAAPAHDERQKLHVAHDAHVALDSETKRRFMHLHWVANSIAYFLMTGFNALLPHLGERLGLRAADLIWLTSSYLFSRAIAFVLFATWEGWHFRVSFSLASIVAAIASAGVMFLSASPGLVFGACVLFGVALGLAYSGSLYYSMSFGEDKGEHGGLHEAILGIGILLGPLAGAGGAKFGGPGGAGAAIVFGAAILATLGASLVLKTGARVPHRPL